MTESSHSAAAQALGYLFQSQWPLVELVRRARERPDLELALEMYDDVSWEEGGAPKELLQLKHHVGAVRSLGDKDADLWRTIAVWMDLHQPADVDGPLLTLVTTQAASAGSACAALRPGTDDRVEAQRLLEDAAADSDAVATASARKRFLGLTPAARSIFVSRMRVLDNSAQIQDLDDQLRAELRLVLPPNNEDLYMDRLWAWWYRVAVSLLRREAATISGLEVAAKVADLRDQFSTATLPTLVGRDDFDPETEQEYSGRVFVEQLRWISLNDVLLQKAVVDYYRAYTQSARWIENHLVGLTELDDFEANLKDEWERAFEFMRLRLPADAEDDDVARAGQDLLRMVTERSQVRLRQYSEAFFTRGKYHELADDGRVGWHPEFSARLERLLLGQAS
jgi:hypothetical protein